MGAELETRAIRDIAQRMKELTDKGLFLQGEGGYLMGARDWEELRALIELLAPGASAGTGSDHRFAASGRCLGCGMTEQFYEQALSVLGGWPKDSEKNERIAELKTCRNNLARKAGARPQR